MRILVIGGTRFLGKHFVETALQRGAEVTLFHRGKTGEGLFPGVQRIHGDRATDLGKLEGGRWDAVVDTCGYTVAPVRASALALRGAADQYLFVSSVSVYADFKAVGIDEDYPVGTIEDPGTTEVNGETYGPLKALCEQEVREAFGDQAILVRPGLIVGPDDPTDRFTYWPVRLARDQRVLAPGDGSDPVQVIDVRDLAAWMVGLLDRGASGAYNAVGPYEPLSWREFLARSQKALGSKAELRWAPTTFLQEREVTPWGDLPVWAPEEGDHAGFERISNARARATGLRFRPIEDTVRDTVAWFGDRPLKAGMSDEKQAELLAALDAASPRPLRGQ